MRIKTRKARWWSKSFLTYRYMWPNIETAISRLPDIHISTILDIGCGHKPYADLFKEADHYIGLNYSTNDASPDVVGSALGLPIRENSVDVVFSTQVLEHVERPWVMFKEIFRVLKPGGHLVLSAPFYWPLHEEPHDFFRFTKHGLLSLAKNEGFKNIVVMADGGDYSRLFLSISHALPRAVEIILRLPGNVTGAVLDHIFRSSDLPANYTLTAMKPKEV